MQQQNISPNKCQFITICYCITACLQHVHEAFDSIPSSSSKFPNFSLRSYPGRPGVRMPVYTSVIAKCRRNDVLQSLIKPQAGMMAQIDTSLQTAGVWPVK